jgi:HEAT repeat protein
VTALLLLFSGLAFADSIDKLGQALLHDRSYRVRAQAAIVLGKLKARRGVPLLIKSLNDKEEAVRSAHVSRLVQRVSRLVHAPSRSKVRRRQKLLLAPDGCARVTARRWHSPPRGPLQATAGLLARAALS